jgi:hypothetical protein
LGLRKDSNALCSDPRHLLLTASWRRFTMLVPRPNGSRRRQLCIRLLIPLDHKKRPFHQARAIALYESSNGPLMSLIRRGWFVEDTRDYVAHELIEYMPENIAVNVFLPKGSPRSSTIGGEICD